MGKAILLYIASEEEKSNFEIAANQLVLSDLDSVKTQNIDIPELSFLTDKGIYSQYYQCEEKILDSVIKAAQHLEFLLLKVDEPPFLVERNKTLLHILFRTDYTVEAGKAKIGVSDDNIIQWIKKNTREVEALFKEDHASIFNLTKEYAGEKEDPSKTELMTMVVSGVTDFSEYSERTQSSAIVLQKMYQTLD